MHHKENTSKVKNLLNIVGTPFNDSNFENLENSNFKELYHLAFKNKIELLFLESLEKNGLIGDLKGELDNQRQRMKLQRKTWGRVIDVLNETKCKYAVIKSIFPFSAVPNDIDIIMLGNDDEYYHSIEFLKKNQFKILGEAKLEINLIDTTTTNLKNYYAVNEIDLYKEVGASRLIYMNKKKLANYIQENEINGRKVGALKPYAEMAVSSFHTIYPERMYTLLIHLFILDTIKKMNLSNIDELIRLCKEQSINNGILNTLRVTETVQEKVFGEIPKELSYLRNQFGKKKNIELNDLPYIYPMKILLNSLWGKRKERTFVISAFRQAVAMLNPRTTNFVIKIHKERASRDTY